MTELYSQSMSQVSFDSKLEMVDGLINIDGMWMPMDFIDSLPRNVDFEYHCNYGTYVENGTIRFSRAVENIEFPVSKLEFNEEIPMVNLTIETGVKDAIITVYPVQLVDLFGDTDHSLLPTIEVIDGVARVPETGMWVIMIDIKGKATTTIQTETNGNDKEIEIDGEGGTSTEDGEGEGDVESTLSVLVTPPNAKVEMLINGKWIESESNYFSNLEVKSYEVKASLDGYIESSKVVKISEGSNSTSFNLIKEDGSGGESIVPNKSLPPVRYDEVYINNIDDFDHIRLVELTDGFSFPSEYTFNDRFWDTGMPSDNHKVDMKTGRIYITGDPDMAGARFIIEAIPKDIATYHRTSVYIDMYEMTNKYIDIDLSKREYKYDLRCTISNPDNCDRFTKYGIFYRSNDGRFDSGVMETGEIGETLLLTIPDGTYTLFAMLYDKDGTEVETPISPSNISPNKDINISLKYNKHIKIYFTGIDRHIGSALSVDFDRDTTTMLLESDMFDNEEYNTDGIVQKPNPVDPYKWKMDDGVYIRKSSGQSTYITVSNMKSYSDIMDNAVIGKQLTGLSDGKVYDLKDSVNGGSNAGYVGFHIPPHMSNVIYNTPQEYKSGGRSYYTNNAMIYNINTDKNIPHIDMDDITRDSLRNHAIPYDISDAKYKYDIFIPAYLEGDSYLNASGNIYTSYMPGISNVCRPITIDKTHVDISTNIPGAEIYLYDTSTGLYRTLMHKFVYSEGSGIYKGTGSLSIDVPSNSRYSATIYRHGFAIKSFSFNVYEDDVSITKNIESLNDWEANISNPAAISEKTADISFNIADGASIDVISVEPSHPDINISGSGIYNAPGDTTIKVVLDYTPPLSMIKDRSPVRLEVGGGQTTEFKVRSDKQNILTVDENTGVVSYESKLSLNRDDNTPNVSGMKAIIHHAGMKEEFNLNSMPNTIDIFGYGEDQYIEIFENDVLVYTNMFLMSDGYTDFDIRIPESKLQRIDIPTPKNTTKQPIILWEEPDPIVAPYYGKKNMNKYTDYSVAGVDTHKYIYANDGDRINYMVYMDGHDPVPGSITISDNNIVNIDNISLGREHPLMMYKAYDSPNKEYSEVYVYNMISGGNTKLNHKTILDGPIVEMWGNSVFQLNTMTKYNIPMFTDGRDSDMDDGMGVAWLMNDVNRAPINGSLKAYVGSRPSTNYHMIKPYYGVSYNNNKHPFAVSNNGLISGVLSVYESPFFMYRHSTSELFKGNDLSKSYLYPSRYKYFASASYSTTYNHPANNNSHSYIGDILVHIVGDVVIEKGFNTRAVQLGDPYKRDTDNRRYAHIISLGENMLALQNIGGNGSDKSTVIDMGDIGGYSTRLDAVRAIGSDIVDRKSGEVPIGRIPKTDPDSFIEADIAEVFSGDEKLTFKFINKTTQTPKHDIEIIYVNEESNLNRNDEHETHILRHDMTTHTILNASPFSRIRYRINGSSTDNMYMSSTSLNTYPERDKPLYYKMPHGDIIRVEQIYNSFESRGYIHDGLKYTLGTMYLESQIPYGVSYDKNHFDDSIWTSSFGDDQGHHRSYIVSANMPAKINFKVLAEFTGGTTMYDVREDILIEGYLDIKQSNTIENQDGTYEYTFSFSDDAIVTDVTKMPDKYTTYPTFPDIVANGEYRAEVGIYKYGDKDAESKAYNGIFVLDSPHFKEVDMFTMTNEYNYGEDSEKAGKPFEMVTRYVNNITGDIIFDRRHFIPTDVNYRAGNMTFRECMIDNNNSIINKDRVQDNPNMLYSKVNFTNITDEIDSIHVSRMKPYSKDYQKIDNTNGDILHQYGNGMFMVIYTNGTRRVIAKTINKERITIDLDEITELPSTNIDLGGYHISTKKDDVINHYDRDVTYQIYSNTSTYTTYLNNRVPIGEYKYVVSQSGYKSMSGTIMVNKDEITKIVIPMKKEEIPKWGSVRFYTTPDRANVYIENSSGIFVRTRRNSEIRRQYGTYKYKVVYAGWYTVEGEVVIDSYSKRMDVSMKKMPKPVYTVSFNMIEPKHGAIAEVKIDDGDWFETMEFRVEDGQKYRFRINADKYETYYGSSYGWDDISIDVEMSKGTGVLRIHDIPSAQDFYIFAKWWGESEPKWWKNNKYMGSLEFGEYEYYTKQWDDRPISYEEVSGTIIHDKKQTSFSVPNKRVFGTYTFTSNIPNFEVQILEKSWSGGGWSYVDGNIPTELKVGDKFAIVRDTEVGSKYLPIEHDFTVSQGDNVTIHSEFSDDNLRSYALYLVVRGPRNMGDAVVESHKSGSWETVEYDSKNNRFNMGEHTVGRSYSIRVNAPGYYEYTGRVTHDRNVNHAYVYLEPRLDGGYMYPLYKNDVSQIMLSSIMKDQEYFEKYKGLNYDGEKFGKLPALEGTNYPIVLISQHSGGKMIVAAVSISKDKRETFVNPASFRFGGGLNYIMHSAKPMKLPSWENDTEVYEVEYSMFGQYGSIGKPVIDRVTRENSKYNRPDIRLGRVTVANIHKVRIIVTRLSDNKVLYRGESVPRMLGELPRQLRVKPSYRANGYYNIRFNAHGSVSSNATVHLRNTPPGNAIELCGESGWFPIRHEWMSLDDIRKSRDGLFIKENGSGKLILEIVYQEKGYYPMRTKIDITDSVSNYPKDNPNITITNDMFRIVTNKYQRNKIDDPVTLRVGPEMDNPDRLEHIEMYTLSGPSMTGRTSYGWANGLTLELGRNDYINARSARVIESSKKIYLKNDHTEINTTMIYDDDIVTSSNMPPSILDDPNVTTVHYDAVFNVSRYDSSGRPIRGLPLSEFDEIVITAITTDRDKYFIYKYIPTGNTNTIRLSRTHYIYEYTLAFRKRGYNTIYQSVIMESVHPNLYSKTIELPTIHPVTE